MSKRQTSPESEYFDTVDWTAATQVNNCKGPKKNKKAELNVLKGYLEEKRWCESMQAEQQYRLEREVRQLRRKVSQWEAEEEERRFRKRRE